MLPTLKNPCAYQAKSMKSHKLKNFCYANVFFTQASTTEDSEKEERLLKCCFALINEGTKRKDIRIDTLHLFVNDEEIVID